MEPVTGADHQEGPTLTLREPDRSVDFDVNRTTVRGWCWGDESAPAVIAVHGAHDHGRMFDELAPAVADLGYHVVAIDLRGHGDSGPISSGMFWSAAVVDLCEIAARLGRRTGPVGLIGHSMGGGLAFTAAGTAPERFRWVISLDALGPPAEAFPDLPLTTLAADALAGIERARRGPRPWDRRADMVERRASVNIRMPRPWVEHLVVHGTRPATADRDDAARDGAGDDGAGPWVWKTDPRFQTGLPDGFNVDAALAENSELIHPVLVLTGTEDDAWSDLDHDEQARRVGMFRHATWVPIPGAGHYVHLEQPARVVDEITRFLRPDGRAGDTAGRTTDDTGGPAPATGPTGT